MATHTPRSRRGVVAAATQPLQPPRRCSVVEHQVLLDHSWTRSRRRGLQVLYECGTGSARIGVGMWSHPRVISPGAAYWLLRNGFAKEQPGSNNHLQITTAGRVVFLHVFEACSENDL